MRRIEKGVLYISALAAIATLITVIFQWLPSNKNLSINIYQSKVLELSPKIEGLEGGYTFEGENIDTIRHLEVLLTNTGNKTIIGRGSNKDLIGESIKLRFADSVNIVKVHPIWNIPEANIKTSKNVTEIVFSQWKPNEQVKLLITSLGNIDLSSIVTTDTRNIQNGDISINYNENIAEEKNPLYKYFSADTVKLLKPIGIFTLQLMTLSFFALWVALFIDVLKNKQWSKKSLEKFRNDINSVDFLTQEEKSEIIKAPQSFKRIILNNLNLKLPPNDNASEKRKDILFLIVMTLSTIGLLPIFISIYYLY